MKKENWQHGTKGISWEGIQIEDLVANHAGKIELVKHLLLSFS